MAVKLRMIGEPDEVARIMHALEKVLDVASAGRTYPVRSGFGVRTYAEVRLPAAMQVVVDQDASQADVAKPAVAPTAKRRELT